MAIEDRVNKPYSCRELLGGPSDAEQADPTVNVASVTRAGLAAQEKSAADISADAQHGNDKQPLHATPSQNKSGAKHTQPQAAPGPTALATSAAMAAVQAASEQQDLSGPSAGVVDSPASKETAALKGSKNKGQSAKCASADLSLSNDGVCPKMLQEISALIVCVRIQCMQSPFGSAICYNKLCVAGSGQLQDLRPQMANRKRNVGDHPMQSWPSGQEHRVCFMHFLGALLSWLTMFVHVTNLLCCSTYRKWLIICMPGNVLRHHTCHCMQAESCSTQCHIKGR